MVLSKNAWYSKFYFFIQSWWAFSKGNKWEGERWESGNLNSLDTDICRFMRAFLIKLPILVVTHAFMYFILFYVFIQFPLGHLGLTGYFVTLIVITGIVGIAIGAYFGNKQLCSWVTKWQYTTPKIKTEPTFLDLIRVWIKARHEKLCVLMTFKDEESTDD